LQRADVVLCRGKKSLFSRLIRWATRSHFSHAAIVFLVPDRDQGFDKVFLIESVLNGVDLTDLRHYVIDHARDYDVVIKRLEAPWFTDEHKRLVRGIMLDFIKAEYDFRTIWTIAVSILKQLVFGFRTRMLGLEETLKRTYAQHRLAPAQFICSGFVQYGFYAAIDRLIARGELPDSCRREVLFRPDLKLPPSLTQLLATTPEDIAQAPQLAWKYVIRDGMVHPVADRAEAYRLLGRKAGS
jgi:hypothetical protein